jgi:hypothetical protein
VAPASRVPELINAFIGAVVRRTYNAEFAWNEVLDPAEVQVNQRGSGCNEDLKGDESDDPREGLRDS